jgi:hypothetical protein
MSGWPAEEPGKIGAADELEIAALRPRPYAAADRSAGQA